MWYHLYVESKYDTNELICSGASGKETACQCGGLRDRVWSLSQGVPLEKGMQSIPVFFPRESYGRRSLGGLQSMGSQRVGHNWSDLAHAWSRNTQTQTTDFWFPRWGLGEGGIRSLPTDSSHTTSLCCTVEINTTLYINYPSFFKKS